MTATADTPTTDAVLSRNCAEGRHNRCLGDVAVFPPVDGRNLVPCACRACSHGARE